MREARTRVLSKEVSELRQQLAARRAAHGGVYVQPIAPHDDADMGGMEAGVGQGAGVGGTGELHPVVAAAERRGASMGETGARSRAGGAPRGGDVIGGHAVGMARGSGAGVGVSELGMGTGGVHGGVAAAGGHAVGSNYVDILVGSARYKTMCQTPNTNLPY